MLGGGGAEETELVFREEEGLTDAMLEFYQQCVLASPISNSTSLHHPSPLPRSALTTVAKDSRCRRQIIQGKSVKESVQHERPAYQTMQLMKHTNTLLLTPRQPRMPDEPPPQRNQFLPRRFARCAGVRAKRRIVRPDYVTQHTLGVAVWRWIVLSFCVSG